MTITDKNSEFLAQEADRKKTALRCRAVDMLYLENLENPFTLGKDSHLYGLSGSFGEGNLPHETGSVRY